MTDFLEEYGTRHEEWQGQVMGDRVTYFYIYEKEGIYIGVGNIAEGFYTHSFDHYPKRREVEEYFKHTEEFKQHYR